MNIADMEAWLTKQGVSFVHMAPDGARIEKAFQEYAARMGDLRPPEVADAFFMVCRLASRSCPHVPVLILEDEGDMDPAAVREALLVTAPIGVTSRC